MTTCIRKEYQPQKIYYPALGKQVYYQQKDSYSVTSPSQRIKPIATIHELCHPVLHLITKLSYLGHIFNLFIIGIVFLTMLCLYYSMLHRYAFTYLDQRKLAPYFSYLYIPIAI